MEATGAIRKPPRGRVPAKNTEPKKPRGKKAPKTEL